MGDLSIDTAVEPRSEGRYRATLSADWEIWGPMGGYVAACALRAAGASSPHPRPAAFACHYLGVARFEPVDIVVETRRAGRTASSQRVEITQEGRPILDAMVWSAADVDGLEHDETTAPDVPGPDALASITELVPEDALPPFPFWNNFDGKPIAFEADWPPDGPRPACWQEWLRFLPAATFDDPWVDAARSVGATAAVERRAPIPGGTSPSGPGSGARAAGTEPVVRARAPARGRRCARRRRTTLRGRGPRGCCGGGR